MIQEHIRVGDTVTLKSGGPVMTVQALSMSLAYCAWRIAGSMHHGTFEVDSLQLADPPAHAPGEYATRGDDQDRATN